MKRSQFAAGAAALSMLLALLSSERAHAGDGGALSAGSALLPRQVKILAGGDVTLGNHLPEWFEELRGKEGYSEGQLLAYPFEKLQPLRDRVDLFWVNLEGTLTASAQKTEKNFNFKAAPADVAILKAGRVDVAHLANNHLYDFGPQGTVDTRAAVLGAGIAAYGAGSDMAEARKPAVLERNGIRIGFLGYLFMGDNTIEPEALYAGPAKPGVAGTHRDVATLEAWVREDIRALRPRVDFVFTSFHWGREGRNLTEPYQRQLARAAVEAGADMVVGHHPHVLQGFERIGEVPVAYSLGNLMFAGNWNPKRKDAVLLEITVGLGPAGSRSLATRFIPVSVDRQPGRPFQPWPYAESEAERVEYLIGCYLWAKEEGACEQAARPTPAPAPAH